MFGVHRRVSAPRGTQKFGRSKTSVMGLSN
jgi:hypothetical protein